MLLRLNSTGACQQCDCWPGSVCMSSSSFVVDLVACSLWWLDERVVGRRIVFFFSSRRRHTRLVSDWSSDVCSSDLSFRFTVISKPNSGKAEALNVGINVARSPYFCTVDADCILEKDSLLRLMYPVIKSSMNTVLSAGIVRILNGCKVENGQVTEIHVPDRAIEKFQVVEYLRSFLFGRTGWNLLQATFIASGAFCIFHRETVIDAAGFGEDTVTEDIDIVASI